MLNNKLKLSGTQNCDINFIEKKSLGNMRSTGTLMHFLLASLALSLIFNVHAVAKFNQVFSWQQLDWDIPLNLKNTPQYIPQNGLPVGIEKWNDKLFVSVPRWKDGKFLLCYYTAFRHRNVYLNR